MYSHAGRLKGRVVSWIMRVCNSDSGNDIYRKIDQNTKNHIKSTAITRFKHVTKQSLATCLAEMGRSKSNLHPDRHKNDARCLTFKTLSREREWQRKVQPGTRRKGNPLTLFAYVSKHKNSHHRAWKKFRPTTASDKQTKLFTSPALVFKNQNVQFSSKFYNGPRIKHFVLIIHVINYLCQTAFEIQGLGLPNLSDPLVPQRFYTNRSENERLTNKH